MKKPEYLQLETSDDVASVRDRLTFLRGKNVLLIWPERGSVLTRKLDLVLIQREAVRNAVRLAVVTHDPVIIRHANELNISAFETIGSSERRKWKRGRSRVFTTRFQRPRHEPQPGELMPYASRVRGEDEETPGERIRRIFVRALVLGVLGGALLATAFLLIPSATITLTPARDFVRVEAQITADPNLQQSVVDVENGVIPATRYQAQVVDTASIETSGRQPLSSTPAIGTIVAVNRTDRSVMIPAGTLVSTSAGTPILFQTTTDATAPAGLGQQVEINIEAVPESTGEVGNVAAGMINTIIGDLAENVEVRNLSATYRGESRVVRTVTQEDRDALVAILRQTIQDRAYRDLAPLITDSQFAILDTLRIAEERSDWMTFDYEVDDFADTLTLTMRAVVEIIAVDENLAQQIAYARLGAQIPRGRVIRPETLVYERGTVTNVESTGQVTFAMVSSAQIVAQVNIQQLQERLASHTPADAMQYLISSADLDPNTIPQISVSPDFMTMLPVLPLRIQIRILDNPPPAASPSIPEAPPDAAPEATPEISDEALPA